MFASGGFFFFGSSGVVRPLPGGTASGFDIFPNPATGSWRFNPDGTVDMRGTDGWVIARHKWYDPMQAGIGAAFYIRATHVGGQTPDTGAMDTWQLLSAPRLWSNTTTSGGWIQCRFLIEISTGASDATVVTSGNYEIETESFQ